MDCIRQLHQFLIVLISVYLSVETFIVGDVLLKRLMRFVISANLTNQIVHKL